jgi:hypothetical protein
MSKIFVAICLLALAGCTGSQPERAAQPAFKGMELYSWKPAGKGWCFSLLPGTNREKSLGEITDPEQAIEGVEPLKRKLAALAKGESVFWRNMANEPLPGTMVDELSRFCKTAGIELQLR